MIRITFILLLLWPITSAIAQTTPNISKITGKVYDNHGNPLDQVYVEVLNYNLPGASTNTNGDFTIDLSNKKVNIDLNSILTFELTKKGYLPDEDSDYTSGIDASGHILVNSFKLFEDKLYIISGRLIAQDGFPLKGYVIELPAYRTVTDRDTTDKLGYFECDVSHQTINLKINQLLEIEILDKNTGRSLGKLTKTPNQYGDVYNIIFDQCLGQAGARCRKKNPHNDQWVEGITDANCECQFLFSTHEDYDMDGIRNNADKCPCIYAITTNGCPKDALRYFLKPLPGLYDQEYLILTSWGVSTTAAIIGYYKTKHFNDKLDEAVTKNQIDMYTDKRNTCRAVAIAGGSGMLITYILDNLNLNKDDHCLGLQQGQGQLGITYQYNF